MLISDCQCDFCYRKTLRYIAKLGVIEIWCDNCQKVIDFIFEDYDD